MLNPVLPEFFVDRSEKRCIQCRVCERQCAFAVHSFDAEGNERHTDYRRMLRIVTDAGYHGYVGIEYEGDKLSEPDGIRATKRLLEKVRGELEARPRPVRR